MVRHTLTVATAFAQLQKWRPWTSSSRLLFSLPAANNPTNNTTAHSTVDSGLSSAKEQGGKTSEVFAATTAAVMPPVTAINTDISEGGGDENGIHRRYPSHDTLKMAPQSLFSSNSGHTTTILHTHHETHSLHLSLPSFPGPAFDGVGQSQPHKEMNNASNNSTSSSLFTRATRGGKLQRSGGGPAANGVGISVPIKQLNMQQQQLRNLSYTSTNAKPSMSNGVCNGTNAVNGKGHANNDSRKVLTMDTINPNVITMEYAVRGPIVNRAVELERLLAKTKENEFPFSNVIKANIGDAHAMGQTPITFIRQVVACVADPSLITSPDLAQSYPDDVRTKALELLQSCGGQSAGAYSQSTGIETIRQHVAQFIEERDGFSCDQDSVCLSGGASESIRNVLKLFVHWHHHEKKKSGIMIPIPQYPLYSASIEEFNLGQVGYYLNEDHNWALDTDELERSLAENRQKYDVRAIVVINPGNPTGQVLTRDNIEAIIQFAHRHHLFIFADEVYQENVYADGAKFHSFRKVMKEMGSPYDTLELASFYSCSKGYMGECGLRGGYVQFENIDAEVYAHFKKMISAKLCSTVLGQITMDCVVDHPKPNSPSYDLWLREKTNVLTSLKERAKMVTDAYNSIEGVHCQQVQGAMYAFPRILLPDKAIVEAKSLGLQPDFFYCSQLLEATGICVVPGSGFGQYPGTWHFRTTILPPTTTFQDMLGRFKGFHEAFLAKYK